MKFSILKPFVACISLALSLTDSALALNYQWDVNGNAAGLGGTGTWNTTNEFWDLTPDGLDDGTGVTTAPTFTGADTAFFGGTAGAVTVDAVTVGGLNFTSSGYTLSAGTITLGANSTILQTTSPSANTTTISSKISGAFKLTLNATSYSQYANLTLSGANDYSGGTDLNHNTIVTIGNAAAFGTGSVTVNGFFGQLRASSALTVTNNFVVNQTWGLYGSNNVTTSGTLNLGAGAPRTIEVDTGRIFRINGGTSNGALTKAKSGILTLAGGSTYTGATTIAAGGGTLRIRNSSSSSGFSIASGTNLQGTNLTLSSTQNITGAGNVSTDSGVFGDFTLNGTNNTYTGSTTASISRFTVGSTGVVNGTSNIDVIANFGANFSNQGSVTTPGAITVFGSGDTTGGGLTTDSSFFRNSGAVSAANLNLNSSSSTNTTANRGGTYNQSAGSTTLSTAATLSPNGGAGAAGTAGNDAALNLSGGTFTAPALALNSGTLTANGGTLTLGATGLTSTGANMISVNFGAATLAASAAWSSSVPATLTDSSTGTTVDTTGGNITLSGILSGSGKLNKAGTGTLILSAGNSYTGSTSVNGGTLGGTGCATSPLLVNPTGILAPGVGVGTYLASAATFTDSTFAVEVDLSTTTADKMVVPGVVDLSNANLTVSEIGAGTVPLGTKFTIIDYTGGSLIGGFNGLIEGATINIGSTAYTISYVDSSKITLTATSPRAGYDAWDDQITNGKTLRTDDADDDGFTNLQEFLFGTDPMASTGSLTTTEKSGGDLIIRWKERTSGATYALKESATLTNPWATSSAPATTDGAAAGDYQPRRANVTIGAGRLFFRVEGVEEN